MQANLGKLTKHKIRLSTPVTSYRWREKKLNKTHTRTQTTEREEGREGIESGVG